LGLHLVLLFALMVLLPMGLVGADQSTARSQNVVTASYGDAISITLSTNKAETFVNDPKFTFDGRYFVDFTKLGCAGILGFEQTFVSPDVRMDWIGLAGDCKGATLTEGGGGQSFNLGELTGMTGAYSIAYRFWNIPGLAMPSAPTGQGAKTQAVADLSDLNAKLKSGQTAEWKMLLEATIKWKIIDAPSELLHSASTGDSNSPGMEQNWWFASKMLVSMFYVLTGVGSATIVWNLNGRKN